MRELQVDYNSRSMIRHKILFILGVALLFLAASNLARADYAFKEKQIAPSRALTSSYFKQIDRAINVYGGRGSPILYGAARRNNYPLCLDAATIINTSIANGDAVFIASGFPILPHLRPETDGPVGAVLLANAITRSGGRPILLADALSFGLHVALSKKVGLNPFDIKSIPTDSLAANTTCHSLFAKYQPGAIVAIEKPGKNKDGRYCNMKGDDISPYVGKVDEFFLEAMNRQIPTIGVGDGGNEIGMGNILPTVRKVVSFGPEIASVTTTTSLVVSSVSNWGASGIISALSILRGVQLVHKGDLERELINTSITAGAIDGVTKKPQASVDGISDDLNASIVEMLYDLADKGIAKSN